MALAEESEQTKDVGDAKQPEAQGVAAIESR